MAKALNKFVGLHNLFKLYSWSILNNKMLFQAYNKNFASILGQNPSLFLPSNESTCGYQNVFFLTVLRYLSWLFMGGRK